MRPERAAAFVLALLCGACSEDRPAEPGADAATDAPPADPDAGVPAPAAPEPPRLEPCPAGWRVIPGEVSICSPLPQDGAPDCAEDEAFFPGGAGCEPVGAPCPAEGDYAEDLPDGAVVWYVRAGAGGGGDGSLGAPFGTIEEGIDAASDGDVVALSRGEYAEAVVVPEGVALRGACPAETRLTTDRAVGSAGVVTVHASGASLSGVTLAGPGPGLWVEGRDATLAVEGVVIAGTDFTGILVGGGGTLTGGSVLVRDVHSQAVPGVSGVGVLVDARGALELERVAFERTGGTAVVAVGTRVVLRDVAIRDGLGEDPPARGVEAQLGAAVELRRLWMSRQRGAAILAFDMDTEIVIEDAFIEDTASNVDGDGGRGLSLVDGARATVRRTTFTGQRELAVIADLPSSAVTLEDVVITGTQGSEAAGTGGSGLVVQSGATATATRVLLAENRGAGLLAISEGTTVTLADVAVIDTLSLASEGDQGTGIHVQQAALTGVRVRAAGNRQAGVVAIADAIVSLEDLDVADTLERACAADTCAGVGFGDGVVSSLGAAVELRRFRIAGSARVGVTVADGALDLHEGEVSGCPIGASVQTEDFDLQRLYDAVVFRDNDRNLDRSQIGVPAPVSEC